MHLSNCSTILILVIIFTVKYLKLEVLIHFCYVDQVFNSTLELCLRLFSDISLDIWTQCILFLVIIFCVVLLLYIVMLSDMGLLANKTPYAVSLEGCLPQIVDDIVKLASQDDIINLRICMHQRGFLSLSMYDTLWDRNSELTTREQMNMIVQDALRGNSRLRVIRALTDAFREIATDRNRCQEIADQIKKKGAKSEWTIYCKHEGIMVIESIISYYCTSLPSTS